MNVNANSLLDASETEAQPRERRKKQAFRFGKDRRKQASLSIGIEISPSGLAFSLFRPQAKQDAVVVEYYPFSGDKGAWSCEWLSDTLAELKDKYRLSGQAVVVALGGDTCVTRAWFGENEVVDANIAEITERTNHYISLGRGEKICCHKETSIDAKNKRAWVTVAHRGVVQNVATAINNAGLRLVHMEHSLASTCAAVGFTGLDVHEPILIAAGEEGRTSLALSYRGQLILDYRPPAAIDTGHGHDAVIQAVRKHIKRLRRYAMRRLPKGENELNRICFPGEAQVSPEIESTLREECGLTCVPVPLDSICGQSQGAISAIADHPESLVAVWLAKQVTLGNESASADISKSLSDTRAISLQSLTKTVWPIAAALLIVAGMHAFAMNNERKVSLLETRLEALQPQRIELKRAKLELTQELDSANSVTALKTHIKNPLWNEILRVTARNLPKGTWLNTVRIESHVAVQIAGTSFTDEDIFEYVQSLKNSQLFQRVSLGATKQVRTSAGPGLDFEITLRVLDDFLTPSEENRTAQMHGLLTPAT